MLSLRFARRIASTYVDSLFLEANGESLHSGRLHWKAEGPTGSGPLLDNPLLVTIYADVIQSWQAKRHESRVMTSEKR